MPSLGGGGEYGGDDPTGGYSGGLGANDSGTREVWNAIDGWHSVPVNQEVVQDLDPMTGQLRADSPYARWKAESRKQQMEAERQARWDALNKSVSQAVGAAQSAGMTPESVLRSADNAFAGKVGELDRMGAGAAATTLRDNFMADGGLFDRIGGMFSPESKTDVRTPTENIVNAITGGYLANTLDPTKPYEATWKAGVAPMASSVGLLGEIIAPGLSYSVPASVLNQITSSLSESALRAPGGLPSGTGTVANALGGYLGSPADLNPFTGLIDTGMRMYDLGTALSDAGVLPGLDLTPKQQDVGAGNNERAWRQLIARMMTGQES